MWLQISSRESHPQWNGWTEGAECEQLQNYLKIIVDDLIMLYEDGIVIKTPEYPDGILIYEVSNWLAYCLTRETGTSCPSGDHRRPPCDVQIVRIRRSQPRCRALHKMRGLPPGSLHREVTSEW
jgi:hypothetical protein